MIHLILFHKIYRLSEWDERRRIWCLVSPTHDKGAKELAVKGQFEFTMSSSACRLYSLLINFADIDVLLTTQNRGCG